MMTRRCIHIKCKILGIYHSGRKGIRYEEITDYEYDGLKNSLINTPDEKEIHQFETVRFDFIGNKPPWYDFWVTSPVIELYVDFDNHYVLETINTIYVLEKQNEDHKNENDS